MADLGQFTLQKVRFPAPAGDYQENGAMASLVRELGDNYGRYHGFLADEVRKVGKAPQPDDYPTTRAYFNAWGWVQELVLAEALLRNCRAYRLFGAPLDAAADTRVPFLSPDDGLISVE